MNQPSSLNGWHEMITEGTDSMLSEMESRSHKASGNHSNSKENVLIAFVAKWVSYGRYDLVSELNYLQQCGRSHALDQVPKRETSHKKLCSAETDNDSDHYEQASDTNINCFIGSENEQSDIFFYDREIPNQKSISEGNLFESIWLKTWGLSYRWMKSNGRQLWQRIKNDQD